MSSARFVHRARARWDGGGGGEGNHGYLGSTAGEGWFGVVGG
jgi:hypothetical protein